MGSLFPIFEKRTVRLFTAFALTAIGAMLFSCILASPPAELVQPPARGPFVVQQSTSPPTSQVLTDFPLNGQMFNVPVEMGDVDDPLEVAVYLDPNTDGLVPIPVQPVAPSKTTQRIVTFSVSSGSFKVPAGVGACHQILLYVANTFTTEQNSLPRFGPTGGDTASWFYNPGGNLVGCSSYSLDAGITDAGGAD